LLRDFDFGLRGSLEKLVLSEVDVRWQLACEDVSQGAEKLPLVEDVAKQHSEDGD
jgi:hypothetical protein